MYSYFFVAAICHCCTDFQLRPNESRQWVVSFVAAICHCCTDFQLRPNESRQWVVVQLLAPVYRLDYLKVELFIRCVRKRGSKNEYTVVAFHARSVFLKSWRNSRLIFAFELFCSRCGVFSDLINMQPLQCIFAFKHTS